MSNDNTVQAKLIMRLFLFFGSVALSVLLVVSSLSDVRAESQDASLEISDPVRTIIERQLRAFREQDAPIAFAMTSENFQNQYRDATHFLKMMRFTHQPLTSHLSYAFMDQTRIGERLVQKVEMLKRDGSSVIVMIRMVQNDHHDWLIDGYTVLESDAQPI